MKNLSYFIYTLSLLCLGIATCQAEIICRTEISYKWKKGDKEQLVHWTQIEQSGENEEEGIHRVTGVAAIEKGKALESCKKAHENLSGCVASRFASMSRTYNQMSFQARKAIEEAINADCTSSQGQCLESLHTEIKCKEKIISAVPEASGTPEAGAKGGKEAKKK